MKKLVRFKETRRLRRAAWAGAVGVGLALVLVTSACGGNSSATQAGSASIRISAPADGATVGREFTLTLDPSVPIGEPSTGRHHVHVYYDGNRSTDPADYGIAYDKSFTVSGLADGPHTIEAVIANADHSLTDARTEIDVTVSSSGADDAPTTTTTPDPYGS